MTVKPKKTLIIGGAASGKSAYAEGLASNSKLYKIYLASANIYDEEMQLKVNKHKIRRGDDWTTISEPLEAKEKITYLKDNQIMLFDCATMWLTNQMLKKADIQSEISQFMDSIMLSKGSFLSLCCPCPPISLSTRCRAYLSISISVISFLEELLEYFTMLFVFIFFKTTMYPRITKNTKLRLIH